MSMGTGNTVLRKESTTKSEPWSAVQPYYKTGFEQAESQVLDRPLEFFPGSTVEPFSPESEQAMGMQTQRALGGDPNFAAGQQQLQATLGNEYLTQGNPWMDMVSNRVGGDVRKQVDSRFAGAGRNMGSPGHVEALARGTAEGMAPYQFGAYEGERARQMGLIPQAQQFGNQPYTDAAALGQVGGMRESLGQEQTAENVARHTFEQLEPSQRIGQFMQLLGGGYGGQTTSFGTSRGGGGGLGTFGDAAGLGLQAAQTFSPKGFKVICTELHRRGWLDDYLYEGDDAHGRSVSPEIIAGYHVWGKPVANIMRHHTWFARVMWVIALPVIHEMASRAGYRLRGSLIGHVMLAVALPLCGWIGRRCNQGACHAA